MDLEPFIAKPVNPGEPVTSQGWNEIVNGLANVVAFLQATAGTSRLRGEERLERVRPHLGRHSGPGIGHR